MQENKRTDEIIDVLLDEVRFPPSLEDDTTTCKQSAILDYPGSNLDEVVLPDVQMPRTLEEGRLRLPYAADNWVKRSDDPDEARQRFNVYKAIQDVTAAERGRFFFNRIRTSRAHCVIADHPAQALESHREVVLAATGTLNARLHQPHLSEPPPAPL